MPTCLPQPIQDSSWPSTLPTLNSGTPPPPLWRQLDPAAQQALAQHLAALIRRILQRSRTPEGDHHEQQ